MKIIQTQPSIQWVLGFFLRVPVARGWRWPPTTSPMVINKQSYTSTPTICLHVMDRHYFMCLVLSSTNVSLKILLLRQLSLKATTWTSLISSRFSARNYVHSIMCLTYISICTILPVFRGSMSHQLLSFRDNLNNELFDTKIPPLLEPPSCRGRGAWAPQWPGELCRW